MVIEGMSRVIFIITQFIKSMRIESCIETECQENNIDGLFFYLMSEKNE
jgi:hypothetical protein